MDKNPTDLLAEFQKLRQETSGISWNLMTNHISSSSSTDETLKLIAESLRSIRSEMTEMKMNQKKESDEQNQQITKSSRRSCCSNNKAVLKMMDENFKTIRKEAKAEKKKQEEKFEKQNRLIKEVLNEIRFARMEIAGIKKQQKEDRKEMGNIKTVTSQIQETLRDPKIVELCGYWTMSQKQPNTPSLKFLTEKQHFFEEANTLTWFFSHNGRQRRFPKVRIGSNECKIREDGKIEIRFKELKYELEVKEEKLTIECNDRKTVYERSNA